MTDARIKVIADDALAIDVATPMEAQRIAASLRKSGDFQDVVAGMQSVSVVFDPLRFGFETVTAALLGAAERSANVSAEADEVIEIALHYGGASGPDLQRVCAQLQLTETDFVSRHTAAEHYVDMIGFTPGFAYISGSNFSHSIPRLATPRPRVAAGSVGFSGALTGLYALAGPGGWPLIGRTDAPLFDGGREDPFLLRPGQRIRFVAL